MKTLKVLFMRVFLTVAIAVSLELLLGNQWKRLLPPAFLSDKEQNPGTAVVGTPDGPRLQDELESEELESSETTAIFVNEWEGACTLYWLNDRDEWIEVVKSFRGEVSLHTFLGHSFAFAREGTKDQIGDLFTVKAGQSRYVLERGTQPRSKTEDPCSDRMPRRCPQLASSGECEKNPGWMIVNCPRACNACDLLDPRKRCAFERLNMTDAHVWQPGDLNSMFEKIIHDFPQFRPRVMSRPPEGPWVVVLDEFFSEEEADVLKSWGHRLGFERSTDSGTKNERGEITKVVSTRRTSSNTWCTWECEEDSVVMDITARIEDMIGVPQDNYESFQLLQYEPGQFYKEHHDMGLSDPETDPAGPRILTFFFYISDVEQGGETEFRKLGLKVSPRKGSAVIWPSVLNERVWDQDARTYHAALPVERGVKYGANLWVHARNFRIPNLHGCTGAF